MQASEKMVGESLTGLTTPLLRRFAQFIMLPFLCNQDVNEQTNKHDRSRYSLMEVITTYIVCSCISVCRSHTLVNV